MSLENAVTKLADSIEKMAIAQNNTAKVFDVLVGILLKGMETQSLQADVKAAVAEKVKQETPSKQKAPAKEPAKKPKAEAESEKPSQTKKADDKPNGAATESADVPTLAAIRKAFIAFTKENDKETAQKVLAGFETEEGVSCKKISELQETERADFLSQITTETGE